MCVLDKYHLNADNHLMTHVVYTNHITTSNNDIIITLTIVQTSSHTNQALRILRLKLCTLSNYRDV